MRIVWRSKIITNNDHRLPSQFPWKAFVHVYMGVLFQNLLARNSGLVIVETRNTTSLFWPTEVQAEFSHLNFGDYLATMAEMQSSAVTLEPPVTVYQENERLSLLFSHAFSDNESIAALRNCFINPEQLQDLQEKLKEILKEECSVVRIGLWSYPRYTLNLNSNIWGKCPAIYVYYLTGYTF